MINVTAHYDQVSARLIMEGLQPGASRCARVFLNREPHVYVTRSGGRVAQRGEDVTMVLSCCATRGTNDRVGCIVPARLFLETQLQTVTYSVTVQNGSVREVKRSMPFGSGRYRENGLGWKSEMLHDQSDEGPYLIQVYPL
jgi:hypothetical protein